MLSWKVGILDFCGGDEIIKLIKRVIINLTLLFLLVFNFGGTVSAHLENGLMVTDILFEQELHANEDSLITVGIVDVKVKKDTGGLDHADSFADADVIVTFSKNEQEIPVRLNHKEDGKYEGVVSFPEPGKWEVVIVANYKNGHESGGPNHKYHGHEGGSQQNVFEATLDVKEPRQSNFMIWTIALLSMGGVLSILAIKRKKSIN
jgi:hypothetical protein